ncbi:RNA methyltransferase [Pannus brasiliensis CCIBt3594]|uniref:tRNA (cytidine/uridine-2'-O-)-methyltransferase TrmJ n=1 Tax=Pannus brasiliensis CCIBt3594 TaxID=1427578 RepID=A0AAW9QRW8_9CHRO
MINVPDRSPLDNVRIILVEPAGPLNVGSVARVMRNMGLKTLIIVNPQCDPLSDDARKMAVHGIEVLENHRRVESLADALEGCHRAIATTSKPRHLNTPLETPRVALPWLIDRTLQTALIFGPEDRGLSNAELNHAQRFVGIPANPEYPSLNLAQSVAVCCYELYQSVATETLETAPEIDPPAPIDQLEGYFRHLESVLLKIGYLYPHTATARMEKFRHFYHRARPTREELALLRGIIGHIESIWQLFPPPESLKGRKKTPPNDR